MLEKLECDRVELLLNGYPWKKKDVSNENKDKQYIGAVETLKSNKIRTNYYFDIVIKTIKDY